jgi:hypothetical protein
MLFHLRRLAVLLENRFAVYCFPTLRSADLTSTFVGTHVHQDARCDHRRSQLNSKGESSEEDYARGYIGPPL